MTQGTPADGAPTRAELDNCVIAIDCLFSTWLRLGQLARLHDEEAARALENYRHLSVREAAAAWREVGATLAATAVRLEELETAVREQRDHLAAILKRMIQPKENQT
jgi:hypothetical protein